jgi:RNA polymerase sigma factor (sigma-70 family)
MTAPDDRHAEPPHELPVESLRRLARGLVLERGAADDVVQDAWLAALQTRGEIRGLGGWLAGAVRKLARNRGREAERRERRERSAARPEAQPSALEATARIEVLRRLLEAVDRLDAPYREAIVLRYFDDLPPREIAARLGVPVNTARTHVRRGIERLRAELDPGSEHERTAFLAALVPLLGPGFRIPVKVLPGPDQPWRRLMQHPLALASSVLLLGTLAWFVGQPNDPGPALGRGNSTTPALAGNVTADPLQQAGTTRVPKSTAAQTPAASGRAPLVNEWTVRGRVTDGFVALPNAPLVGRVFAGGRPVGPALLEETLSSDASGAFAWSLTPPEGLYSVEVEPRVPGYRGRSSSGWFLAGDPAPEDWSLASYALDVTLRGTVRGPDGAPLAGAFVGLDLGDEARAVRSASDGSFELGCSSARSPRIVCTWAPGFAPGYVKLDAPAAGATIPCELALEPELFLHGVVRGPDGSPLAGAEVVLDEQIIPTSFTPPPSGDGFMVSGGSLLGGPWPRVTTGADGRYVIGGVHPHATIAFLRASAPGTRPAERPCSRPATMGTTDQNLTLEPGVTLTGRVRAAGEPAEAAWISVGESAGELESGGLEKVEAWCDPEGRFTLTSVPTGAQHLWIWRRGHAQLRHDVNVQPGMGTLELELAPGHFVAGLVLGPDGAPKPWATIFVEDTSGAEPPRLSGFGATADAEGRFRITDLPEAPIALQGGAHGCEWMTQAVALDRDDVELRLVAAAEPVPPPPAPVPVPVVPVTAASGGASLAGRLLDLAGNDLAGAEIELAAVETTLPAGPWHATTGANGEFTLAGLPAGSFDARWLRHEGALTAIDLETRFTLASDEARSLELRPLGQTTLHGTIEFRDMPAGSVTVGYGTPPPPLDETLPPLVAVQLVRTVENAPVAGTRRGAFAHDGLFQLEGVPAGKWTAEAELVLAGDVRTHCSAEVEVTVQGSVEFALVIFRH